MIGGSQFDGRTHSIHLNVNVERFEARKNGFALTTARWQALGCYEAPETVGFARASQRLGDDTPDGIVHAWSENLQNLSKQIATFIPQDLPVTIASLTGKVAYVPPQQAARFDAFARAQCIDDVPNALFELP